MFALVLERRSPSMSFPARSLPSMNCVSFDASLTMSSSERYCRPRSLSPALWGVAWHPSMPSQMSSAVKPSVSLARILAFSFVPGRARGWRDW